MFYDYDISWSELQNMMDLPESMLRVPVRVPTVTKDGRKSRQLQVVQRRGTRPPPQLNRFVSSVP
jgi:hypothetical protein